MARNFRLNNDGFYAIRSAPKVVAKEQEMAKKIADKANRDSGLVDGYRTSSTQGRKKPQGRWRTTVITATAAAIEDNSKNNRLLRSLDAGRD